jgi:glycosyltransferase involved in cell wall biosynthesis
MSSQRVAYLTGEYPRATDTWIQREVASLRELGVSVDTFSVRDPGPAHEVGPEQVEARASTTYLLPATPTSIVGAHIGLMLRSPRRYVRGLRLAWSTRRPGIRGLAYQLAYFAEAGLLARQLRARKIEHLHNHFGDSSCSVSMLTSELSGVPFSFTLHGPGIFFEAHTWRLDEKLSRASFCACISYFCRSQAAIFAPQQRWDRLHIVHCGIEPERYEPSAHLGDPPRLLFVGRIAKVKGVAVLLEAMSKLSETHPVLQLDIVGDGPDRPEMERNVAELGLSDRVTFLGYRSQAEVAELLETTDVFVLPSFAEGVPVTLMEAMGAAVPVVTTQVGGITELVVDGETGFIVRPGDPDVLADRIARLVDDPELRRRMGRRGREVVEADFTNRTEASRLKSLFEHSRAGRRAPLRPLP